MSTAALTCAMVELCDDVFSLLDDRRSEFEELRDDDLSSELDEFSTELRNSCCVMVLAWLELCITWNDKSRNNEQMYRWMIRFFFI